MIIDLIYISIFLGLGWAFSGLLLKKKEQGFKPQLRTLLFFHFFIGLVFFFYTTNGGGDAWGYWKISRSITWDECIRFLQTSVGTYFMYAFNYPFGNVLGMSFLANTLLYSLFGYIGLVFFFVVAVRTVPTNSRFFGYKLFPLIFFLPNLHYWSAGLGKDTLVFLCIGAFTYGLLKIEKRWLLVSVSVLLIYFVRAPVVLFLFVSFAFALVFDPRVSTFKRVALLVILVAISVAILPAVLASSKIQDASIESFNKFADNSAALLSRSSSGSAVDVSNYPFPLKVFTFLYRPFFIDGNSLRGFLASFENLAFLLLCIYLLRHKPLSTFMKSPFIMKGLVIFFMIGTLALSQTLGNLGIMVRMKNMFMPGILIYIMYVFSLSTLAVKNRWKSV